MVAALQHLPALSGTMPTPSLTLPLRAWAIAAAIGAGIGMLLLTPVSLVRSSRPFSDVSRTPVRS
jgi:hypothetical protein